MRVRLSVFATACASLGSLFFFACGGPNLRKEEQIKADLVGKTVNARCMTAGLESGRNMEWTIRPGQIESLRILRRNTDMREGTDIVDADIRFQAAKVKFKAAQGEEPVVTGGGWPETPLRSARQWLASG